MRGTPTGKHTDDDSKQWHNVMKIAQAQSWVDFYTHNDWKKSNNVTRYIPAFCDMLSKNKVIACLNLDGNVFLRCLCKVLRTCDTIRRLELKHNPFSDSAGVCHLEQLLLHNRFLKYLCITIGSEGLKYIARALPYNSTLIELSFTGSNTVDITGMRILSNGLLHNHSIKVIKFNETNINDQCAQELCSVFEVNHTVEVVDFCKTEIVRLPETYAFLSHIKSIDLAFNNQIRFPPLEVVRGAAEHWGLGPATSQDKLSTFFSDFRRFRVRFHFLLGLHTRVGINSSLQAYLNNSSIFEPALLSVIFGLIS